MEWKARDSCGIRWTGETPQERIATRRLTAIPAESEVTETENQRPNFNKSKEGAQKYEYLWAPSLLLLFMLLQARSYLEFL
ncbi:hypothetical protein EJA10_19150 [Mesobacillus subterraneus]|uniref:Uncharacterized protein n=1 Tax=Mesobacillus subterraneus TaxID=285983 RepID=A0A427TK33_9BACI|nr:hypothetical protein EJA10_19150 [Mesobacillus subterraneus]